MADPPPDSAGDSFDAPSDRELYRNLRAGDRAALGNLYARYSSLVYRLALQMLTRPQEAEDLTQEVFLYLWRSDRYSPERGSLGSFLITVTRSRALDRLRSRSTQLKLLQQWGQTVKSQTPPLTPFELASLNQRSDYVQAALAQLPEKQRTLLELAYYKGLSQSEIATELALPLGTVKTWSRQGLLSLRKHLSQWIESP